MAEINKNQNQKLFHFGPAMPAAVPNVPSSLSAPITPVIPSIPIAFSAVSTSTAEKSATGKLFTFTSKSAPIQMPQVQPVQKSEAKVENQQLTKKPEAQKQPEKNDPFLLNLITQKKENESKTENPLLKSLIKTEEKAVEKKKSILGELPKIDTSLFIDREYHLKKQLSVVRFVFAFLLLAAFGGFVYFYSQLTPTFDLFGQNTAQKLEDKNSQLKNLQTEVNLLRVQSSKALLDAFSYSGDAFLQKFHEYQIAQTDAKKADLLVDINQIREDMYEPFDTAREKLLAQNWVVLFRTSEVASEEAEREFHEYLKERLRNERKEKLKALQEAQQVSAKEQLKAELLQNYELLQLVGKPELKKLLQQNIREMSNDQLKEFIGSLSLAYPSRLGFVYDIKQKRVPWAKTIREIADKTKTVDPLFRTGFFEKLGGILYNAFDFDASSGRVGVSGRAKSDDGTNFSILANLIDELEGSALFQDTDMRSFSKRLSEGGGYEGSFKIDFQLQTDLINEKDKQYQINKTPNSSEDL